MGCFVVPERENRLRPGLAEADREAICRYVRSLPEVDATKVVAGTLVNAYADNVAAWREFCRATDAQLGPLS